MSKTPLWIFGYGSLVWRPAFAFRRRYPASIRGWVRRFWQGSIDHRGLPHRPGRVVTLLPANEADLRNAAQSGPDLALDLAAPCWGTAYEVAPDVQDQVLQDLDYRERGGYERHEVEIEAYPAPGRRETCSGLVYIAGTDNVNYLGAAPVAEIAQQIASAEGPSGPNPEYVFELAKSLRKMQAEDRHVFAIEAVLEGLVAPGRT